VIETKFRFFQVQIKLVPSDAVMLTHFAFHVGPERFNTVDVVMVLNKLLRVIDAMMFVAREHQAVVATPLVGIDVGFGSRNKLFDDGNEGFCRNIRNHCCIDFALAFQDTNDGNLVRGSSTPFIATMTRAKV